MGKKRKVSRFMRVEPELTYQDYKDGVIGAFNL